MRIAAPAALRPLLVTLVLVPLLSSAAAAQDDAPPRKEPIGRFVLDARGAMPRFKEDPALASTIGVDATNLPTRGYGVVLGAHVYPLRMGRVTLGLGGEVLASRAGRTAKPVEEDGPDGPTVRTRLSAISPQVSLNFGSRQGWSYISGGMGWSRFSVEVEDAAAADAPDPPRRQTINYGGGARWFAKEHVAFTIDLRFYSLAAQAASTSHPAMAKMRVMVFSVGAAFK